MNFNYDDHLINGKRKNQGRGRLLPLLLVSHIILIGILILLLLNLPKQDSSFSTYEIEATIDARMQSYLERDPTLASVTILEPTHSPATLTPRPQVTGDVLEKDMMVRDTITNSTFEIHYTYEGQANTPIIVTMYGLDLEEPALVLTNPYGKRIIASVTAEQTIGNDRIQVIGAVLPVDGQYTITATRLNGRAGNAYGDFELTLEVPTLLESNSRVTGTAQSSHWQWYVYGGDEAFSVNYALVEGNYYPEVGIYQLNAQSELKGLGYLLGDGIRYGTLGRFSPDIPYFIAIGQPTFMRQTSENESTSVFTLGIQIAR